MRVEAPQIVNIRSLSHHTKDVIDRVEAGEELFVIRHGKVVALIVPVSDD